MDTNISVEECVRACKLCNKHLGGAWKQVSLDQVNISKLSGGMSNLLYHCALLDTVKTFDKEPREVLLRLYGPSYGDTDIQIDIFNKLATENLGPSLYASFNEGRFEEYFPSAPLTWQELIRDDISAVVAKKMAAIHKLNIKSLDKTSNWLLDQFYQMNDFVSALKRNPPEFNNGLVSESTKNIALELLEIDFELEIRYLAKVFQESNSPLVFSHNDLHQNNIILLNELNKSLDERVVLIDFEYCSYNYRTFDIANHLSEWCFDYNGNEYPYFSAFVDRFPSEAKQRQFLSHYANQFSDKDFDLVKMDPSRRKSDLNNLNKFVDKVDLLYDEMQPFLMASNLFWSIWAVKMACTSKIRFGYWEMAKQKWDIYLLCKGRFIQRKSKVNSGCERGESIIVQSSKM